MNRRTILLAGSFAAALAIPAWAQARKPVRTGTAQSAPPAQPVVVNTTGLPAVPVPTAHPVPTQTSAPSPVNSPQPQIAQITWYPTIVLADGRVLANFGTGRGYEEVLRQCPQLSGPIPPNMTIAPCYTRDSYGVYHVMQRR